MQQLARFAAAVVMTAAAGLILPVAPAAAASCQPGAGVTVVVDFHELGGGVQQACISDGAGRSAAVLFESSGFSLTRVQNEPGFVCRVAAKPADNPCVNTPSGNAYWSLWAADATSGTWDYASLGADGLSVPDGGSVAFSWKEGSGDSPPGVSPPARAAVPTASTSASPTPLSTTGKKKRSKSQPSARPSSKPSATPSADSTPAPAAPTSSNASRSTPSAPAFPTKTATMGPGTVVEAPMSPQIPRGEDGVTTAPPAAEPSAEPTVEPTDADDVAPAAADGSDGGLPVWVAPAVLVVLLGAAGAVAVTRRRRPS